MNSTIYSQNLSGLSQDTLGRLNDLIRINIDSAKGFEQAAESVDVASYASLFRELGMQRADLANQLRGQVLAEGQEPVDHGSIKGTAHRWWLNLRDKITTSEAYDVLAEAERGEDYIKGLYEKVLDETNGSPIHDLILQQYAKVKQGHDRVRDLRDAEKQVEKHR